MCVCVFVKSDLFVSYTWLADVNASAAKCLCVCAHAHTHTHAHTDSLRLSSFVHFKVKDSWRRILTETQKDEMSVSLNIH
jgi:hypothetical protein